MVKWKNKKQQRISIATIKFVKYFNLWWYIILQDQLEESLNESQLGNNYNKSHTKKRTGTDVVYTC
jgi:hypothetical protein